jgi:general secretion pathway protein M
MSLFSQAQQRFRASAVGRWLAEREPGEQRVVLALVVAVSLTVLWLGIWKPISDWRTLEHNRYQNAQSLLDWVQVNEARGREVARGGEQGDGNKSLLPLVTRSADAQGIRINRLQPESNSVVSVVIQAQPFNEVLSWLQQLQVNNGISVQRVSIDSEGTSGLINAQIRLR